MQSPQQAPRALLRVGVQALICALALPAAAQTSGRFPDVPPEPEPEPAAQPPPGPAPPPPAPPPVAAPPPPPEAYQPPPYPGAWPAEPGPQYYPEEQYVEPAPPGGFYPAVLPYRADDPVPAGYQLQSSRNTGLMTGGAVVFGLGYVIGFGIAASNGFDRPNGMMIVPMIGPWVSLFRRESPCDIEDVEVKKDAQACVNRALDEAALIGLIAIDGLVQAVGAGLFLGGVFSKTEQLVREDMVGLRVLPQPMGRDGYGLGLRARF